MKNPIFKVIALGLCLSFGVLALCQDKMFAVVFAIAVMGFSAYVELDNRK